MDKGFFDSINQVLQAIHTLNENCIIMLGALLPSSMHTHAMISMFTFCNDKLARHCTSNPRLEHARPGKHLLGPRGPMDEYFDGQGNVNEFGCDVIAGALERKIYSTKLVDHFRELQGRD